MTDEAPVNAKPRSEQPSRLSRQNIAMALNVATFTLMSSVAGLIWNWSGEWARSQATQQEHDKRISALESMKITTEADRRLSILENQRVVAEIQRREERETQAEFRSEIRGTLRDIQSKLDRDRGK